MQEREENGQQELQQANQIPPAEIYVVGFAFSPAHDEVVLIRKDHPEWQKGKLNGVGGKLRRDPDGALMESVHECMVREYREEAGVETRTSDWHPYASIFYGDALIHFLCTDRSIAFYGAKTMESEPIEQWSISRALQQQIIPNLNWLIPMAIDSFRPTGIVHMRGDGRMETDKS